MKIGIGYDVHRLVPDRRLIIGGVDIPFEKGLSGHSDADVLVHAVMDSLIGAMGLGDIGVHFPDTEDGYKNISSLVLLGKVYEMLSGMNYKIGNIDAVIIAERPKFSPYFDKMKFNLASVLKTDAININIKATTEEGLGFTGEGSGIAAKAVCVIENGEI